MRRIALILFLTLCASRSLLAASIPVDDLFKQAQAAIVAHDFDAAIPLYEQVLTGHPEAVNRWFDAQAGIAQALAKKGDLDGAAKAIHLCLDGAPDVKTFDSAINIAAAILSALDQNVTRANQLIEFQKSGPAGGAANPMDTISYPVMPGREQAFELMRKKAGDTTASSRLRAFTFLFTGKPKDALEQFADAFRRSSTPTAIQRSAPAMVLVGLRAVRGHRIGLDKCIQFVVYGPNGPDGKPGTADDIADPFAEYLPAAPAPGQGGLAELSADDLRLLQRVRDSAELYGGDHFIPGDMRRSALSALARVNDALDNWGASGQQQWYFEIEKQILGSYKSRDYQPDWSLFLIEEKIVGSIQSAAKGRSIHLGAVVSAMAELDAYCTDHGIKPTEGKEKVRQQFVGLCSYLNKITIAPPAFKPLAMPAKF